MHGLAATLISLHLTSAVPVLCWDGEGEFRVLVQVDAAAAAIARSGDERPAEVTLNFESLLSQLGFSNRTVDVTTVQVMRYDPTTSRPMKQGKFAFGKSGFDIPWRWYDAAIPYEFPENDQVIQENGGKLSYKRFTRMGYFYNCIGDWDEGRLGFIHRETPQAPAWYAIYFDLLAEDEKPNAVPPRGWLGDGLSRCEPTGDSTTGLIHSRVEVGDWNGDGLFDLIVGCARGGIVWYPNQGSPGKPDFPYSRLMFTSDGLPLDVGWSATPCIVDWDGDGLPDIISGAESNRVLLYRNVGTKKEPLLEYTGLVRTENGEALALPSGPVLESPEAYADREDYYPVLEMVDWDGDGDLDSLAGGYATGQIYFYENVASEGAPIKLRLIGPLAAEGKPIDVLWCAAPAVADLDGDGDLDLVTGNMSVRPGPRQPIPRQTSLRYFRNDGTRQEPQFHEVPFPAKGSVPHFSLGTPRFVDWSNDGLLDLVVSAGANIYLFRNVGSRATPLFEVPEKALPSDWGAAGLSANQFLDWNGDGLLDCISAPHVQLNSGGGSPGTFDEHFSLFPPGKTISHRAHIGDDWSYQRLFDLDGDGTLDLMDADHAGHFWWHRNRGTSSEPEFDLEGTKLLLTDDTPAHVRTGDVPFDIEQGARATYTIADFGGDSLPDMVAANTLGEVSYFRQSNLRGDDGVPRFEMPVQIGKLVIRAAPGATDWDQDGQFDVVVAANPENVFWFRGRGSKPGTPFEEARPLSLPNAPFGAGAPLVIVDYNGDGDQDILLYTAYGYCCFYERSFLDSGYAKGEPIVIERRSSSDPVETAE